MATYSNSYTFNRTSTYGGVSPGYHTRTLFTFSNPTFPALTGSWTDTLNYDGISAITSSFPTYCYGDPAFPGSYWRAGKSVRVRGTLFMTSNGQKFNLRFGINTAATTSIQWLAVPNYNLAEHTAASTTTTTPVDFQCIITCLNLTGSGDSIKFNANGYYEYSLNNDESLNDEKISAYVPLGFLDGGITTVTKSFYDNESYITFNLNGTVLTSSLAFLTIEELA